MISRNRISDRTSQSGVPFYMRQALEQYVGDVTPIDGLRPRGTRLHGILDHRQFYGPCAVLRSKQLFWKLLRRNYRWQHTAWLSKYYARKIQEALEGEQYDLLFTDMGSAEIAYLNTDIPLIYGSDATFALLVDYYRPFFRLSRSSIREGNHIEQRAINNATICLYHSKWAAASAIDDYGAPKEKVRVSYFGPCINSSFLPALEEIRTKETTSRCNLLLLGVDWHRKGCDIAVETVARLAGRGIDAHLTVCGCTPPGKARLPGNVTVIPFLNKNKKAHMEKIVSLYKEATYLIFPTRAEALAGVLIEACAFGLPICSTDVGGTTEVVKDGANGFIFSLSDGPDEYAARIASSLSDPEGYQKMSVNAYNLYRNQLSWKCWSDRMVGIISHDMGKA